MSRRTLGSCLALLLGIGSCTTSSIGLDLTIRGVLSFFITRPSASAGALATGFINDSGSFGSPLVELQSNQVFSVNGVNLQKGVFTTYFAPIGSVEAPSEYTVAFDNAGASASMTVTPPVDFTSTTPAAGTSVSRTGFNVGWSPSGDSNVLVDIEIRGLGPDGDDQNIDPDSVTVNVKNLPDNGTATLGAGNLQGFLNGEITVKILRFRSFNQSIGLSSGTVRTEIYKETTLTLTN